MAKDPVSIDIDRILRSSSGISPEVCIFKVHNHLREVNKNAYEPQMISIGPYHHGKDHLKAMETHKVHYLQMLLKEKKEKDASQYVKKMRDLEKRARSCYADPVNLGSDDFVKMMLLDGCFIVQLIRMRYTNQQPDTSNFIMNLPCLLSSICYDMLLVENQLPYFVIWELFVMIDQNPVESSFKDKVFKIFSEAYPYKQKPIQDWKPFQFKHILHFIHHCFHAGLDPINSGGDRKMTPNHDWKFIRSATALQEAGMKFKEHQGNSLFDIKFETSTGTLMIPRLEVADQMERSLRNFVAFEQLYPHQYLHHVTDYITLMDYLIDSAKDVEILCQHGIIVNMLGDNEAVTNMFNRLGKHVMISQREFYYSEQFNQMNKYCDRNKRWNKLIAHLKRNYFNSPWAPLVSVLAASLLLLLTVLQTLFTILSYKKD